jgi:hypothetical protein
MGGGMHKNIFCLIVFLTATLAGCSTPTHFVSPTMGATLDTVMQMATVADNYKGKSICANGATMGDLGKVAEEYSKSHPEKGGRLSDKDIYLSLASHYPCPFNPKLAPVKQAASTDLIGHWELAPASLKIKTNVFQRDPFPSNCEYFAFSEDGDMRSFQMITPDPCPSVTASEFSKIKNLPKVIDWKLGSDGLLRITRSDIQNYIESWEAFIVTSSFSQSGVEFKPGDLLLFMAQFNKMKKEEIGTLYFRQFRKMAGS